MRALFTLADISGWALIHWLTRQPPTPPTPQAYSSSLHPFCLSLQTSLLWAHTLHINMDILMCNVDTYVHTLFCCLNFLKLATPFTCTCWWTHKHTHIQYSVLEMHGGRLLRRGKPSVNDSSRGKIMFLMQRWVRRWWREMTFWMVKWVNVRSLP